MAPLTSSLNTFLTKGPYPTQPYPYPTLPYLPTLPYPTLPYPTLPNPTLPSVISLTETSYSVRLLYINIPLFYPFYYPPTLSSLIVYSAILP